MYTWLHWLTLPSSQAQNSPQDYLNAHNSARAAVGVGPMTWDKKVAAYAQSYADKCKADCHLVHSNGGGYGGNLARGSDSSFTGTKAVELWIAEKAHYNYGSNLCDAGKVCEHYTQVVWKKSVRIGCARVQCYNG